MDNLEKKRSLRPASKPFMVFMYIFQIKIIVKDIHKKW